MIDLLISGATLFCAPETVADVAVNDGKIVAVADGIELESRDTIDGSDCLLVPGLVEAHLHLDIALTNHPGRPGRTEPYRSHYQLNETLERRRRHFTHADIVERATRALTAASKQGVTHMRAQCHVDRQAGLKHVRALNEAREACREIIDLELVSFPQQGLITHSENLNLFERAFTAGIDVMGCAPNLDRGPDGSVRTFEHIDMAVDFAAAHGVPLDAHVDLGISEIREFSELESVYLARKTIEQGLHGKVTAGHVCRLGCLEPVEADKAINLFREAEMHVVSQPDLYRLGRQDKAHVRRGLTRVKDLTAGGVNVALASNNVRDALRPMGNFDLLEEALVLAYGAHMDSVEELETLLKMCTWNPARILGLTDYGLTVGSAADLVVLECSTPQDAVVSRVKRRSVIKRGVALPVSS